jgi:hypothetical protein
VLYLNPHTGKQMSYHELCVYVKKKADTSPRILNLLLDHPLDKPPEQVEQMQTLFILHGPEKAQEDSQDALVLNDGQRCLVLGKQEEE